MTADTLPTFEIDAQIADLRERMAKADQTLIVLEVEGHRLTRNEVREFFELVENKANWKGPVDSVVPAHKAARVRAAVQFFHGGPLPRMEWINGDTVRIIGRGYAC